MALSRFYEPPADITGFQPFQLPFEAINASLAARQKKYDEASEFIRKQNEAFSSIRTREGFDDTDLKIKNDLLSEYKNSVEDLVQNKYDGDYSKATGDIHELSLQYAQNPFWQKNMYAVQEQDKRKKLEQGYKEQGVDYLIFQGMDTSMNEPIDLSNPNQKFSSGAEVRQNWHDNRWSYYNDLQEISGKHGWDEEAQKAYDGDYVAWYKEKGIDEKRITDRTQQVLNDYIASYPQEFKWEEYQATLRGEANPRKAAEDKVLQNLLSTGKEAISHSYDSSVQRMKDDEAKKKAAADKNAGSGEAGYDDADINIVNSVKVTVAEQDVDWATVGSDPYINEAVVSLTEEKITDAYSTENATEDFIISTVNNYTWKGNPTPTEIEDLKKGIKVKVTKVIDYDENGMFKSWKTDLVPDFSGIADADRRIELEEVWDNNKAKRTQYLLSIQSKEQTRDAAIGVQETVKIAAGIDVNWKATKFDPNSESGKKVIRGTEKQLANYLLPLEILERERKDGKVITAEDVLKQRWYTSGYDEAFKVENSLVQPDQYYKQTSVGQEDPVSSIDWTKPWTWNDFPSRVTIWQEMMTPAEVARLDAQVLAELNEYRKKEDATINRDSRSSGGTQSVDDIINRKAVGFRRDIYATYIADNFDNLYKRKDAIELGAKAKIHGRLRRAATNSDQTFRKYAKKYEELQKQGEVSVRAYTLGSSPESQRGAKELDKLVERVVLGGSVQIYDPQTGRLIDREGNGLAVHDAIRAAWDGKGAEPEWRNKVMHWRIADGQIVVDVAVRDSKGKMVKIGDRELGYVEIRDLEILDNLRGILDNDDFDFMYKSQALAQSFEQNKGVYGYVDSRIKVQPLRGDVIGANGEVRIARGSYQFTLPNNDVDFAKNEKELFQKIDAFYAKDLLYSTDFSTYVFTENKNGYFLKNDKLDTWTKLDSKEDYDKLQELKAEQKTKGINFSATGKLASHPKSEAIDPASFRVPVVNTASEELRADNEKEVYGKPELALTKREEIYYAGLSDISQVPKVEITASAYKPFVHQSVKSALEDPLFASDNNPGIAITGAFRGQAYNESLGDTAAKNSDHLMGLALDLNVDDSKDFIKWLEGDGKDWATKYLKPNKKGDFYIQHGKGKGGHGDHFHLSFLEVPNIETTTTTPTVTPTTTTTTTPVDKPVTRDDGRRGLNAPSPSKSR